MFERSSRWGAVLALATTLLAAGTGAVPAARADETPARLQADTLAQAQVIRAEVTARYRGVPGRRLVVTEASPTWVVGTLTLVTDILEEQRVVSAGNGLYYEVCPVRAQCPYPRRSASRPVSALLPRRLGLELALRTFLETSADLVVVLLPTEHPTWAVFERNDLLADVDSSAVPSVLAEDLTTTELPLRQLVVRITRPRLFVPLFSLPPSSGTIFALSLFGS